VVIRDLVDTKTCQADIGSIIAYALASPEYDSKRQRLRDTWGQDGVALSLKRSSLNDSNEEQQTLVPPDVAQEASGLEDSASQHIELQFADATVKYYCKVGVAMIIGEKDVGISGLLRGAFPTIAETAVR
jgi:hypothetical protein